MGRDADLWKGNEPLLEYRKNWTLHNAVKQVMGESSMRECWGEVVLSKADLMAVIDKIPEGLEEDRLVSDLVAVCGEMQENEEVVYVYDY